MAVKIEKGGELGKVNNQRLKEIKIHPTEDKRQYEFWINDSSLSYLSVQELVDLSIEVDNALKSLTQR